MKFHHRDHKSCTNCDSKKLGLTDSSIKYSTQNNFFRKEFNMRPQLLRKSSSHGSMADPD